MTLKSYLPQMNCTECFKINGAAVQERVSPISWKAGRAIAATARRLYFESVNSREGRRWQSRESQADIWFSKGGKATRWEVPMHCHKTDQT